MPEWDFVRNHGQLHWCVVHQCMTNLRENRQPYLHLLKPTEFWASHYLLIKPLLGLKCDRSHEHSRAQRLGTTALYSAKFAGAVARGHCT